MKVLGLFALAVTFSVGAGTAHAKKAKHAAKAAKVEENPASTEEIGKLKGEFKWGMSPQEVVEVVHKAIDAKYTDRLKKAGADPAKQDRIRTEMRNELNNVKQSYIKFEGSKTGWDVSVVDQEFGQGSNESMLVSKEDQWTRHFFFFEDKLYKMYLALEKEALKGKNFEDFGAMMQQKYGKARLVMRDEKQKGGAKKVPDFLVWASITSDSLRLVDRSAFYGVYCLVVYDAGTQDRVIERRKVVNPGTDTKESLVEAVTAKEGNDRDSNDNIIDRLTGREIKKPGEEPKHADIVVPSVRAPTAKEVNESSGSSSSSSKDKGKKGKKDEKPSGLDGVEL